MSSSSRFIELFAIILWVSSLITSSQGQTTDCSTRADCEDPNLEYCADGVCMLVGSCEEKFDCYNPENNFASDAADDCVGYLQCRDAKCVKTCGDSFCEPDWNVGDLFCPTVMCRIEDCDGAVSCVNHNCFGCDIIYFDAKGTQICSNNSTVLPNNSCSSNSDCLINIGENQTDVVRPENFMTFDQPYCAGGFCADPGTCTTDFDCVNPSNHYEIIECVGPIVCKTGQCTRDCGTGSMCKDGVEQTYCFANPCDVSGCVEESTGCFADYCSGGCDAIHFDAAGNVLEDCDDTPFQVPESCTKDEDCHNEKSELTSHYCSSGSCKAMGACSATSDCFNPSNEVGFATCTGYEQCTSDGQCEHVCSNSEHCCFISLECTADQKESCPDAVTCVKDNCNDSGDHCGAGTGTFYFDSAGNSICTGKEAPTIAPTVKPPVPPTVPSANTTENTTDLPDGAIVIGTALTMMTVMIVTVIVDLL